jgi:hypothetical protein
MNRLALRKGQYKLTDEHRKHVSDSIKAWWSVPENKERMIEIQTRIHRRSWSEESKKQLSDSMKLSWKKRKNRGKKSK